jgi:hypothetical protein
MSRNLPERVRTRSEISARTSRQSAGVRSQGGVTGKSGEDAVAKGPGRDAPGDCTSASEARQSPLSDEALGLPEPFVDGVADAGDEPRGWCVWPPGDKGPESDR